MQKTRYLGLLWLLAGFLTEDVDPCRGCTPNNSFDVGELLTYRIHYGCLDAGRATMQVDSQLHEVNGRLCYRIDVSGVSKGLLYVFLKMENQFVSYLDATALVSQRFSRCIREGKYKKDETVIFDHTKNIAIVQRLDADTQEPRDTVCFAVSEHIQDIVSSWYTLRMVDFSKAKKGDVFSIPIFFDDILYKQLQVRFIAKKVVKTKQGKFNALVLAPIIPFVKRGPSIFDGANSVELFLSDDQNKIPLKIKVKLLIGAVEIDLVKYQGLKNYAHAQP